MYYNNRDVRLEEVPVPKIGPGELLIRTRASGICGSDLMEWYRIKKAPLVLGHEITGEVTEVGEGVKDFKVGDRVFSSHHVPCGRCRYCLSGHQSVCDLLRTTHFDPGGFAEYIRVPKINVELGTLQIPDTMTFDEGSFIEPLACVVRAQRFAGVGSGTNGSSDRQRHFRSAPHSTGARRAARRGLSRPISAIIGLKAALAVRRGCGDSRRGGRAGTLTELERRPTGRSSDRLHRRHAGDSAGDEIHRPRRHVAILRADGGRRRCADSAV